MASISLRDVGITANVPLFSNLNIVIGPGDRVGLVAGNGAGKTTLLRALVGTAEPSHGEIIRSRGLTIGLVEQDVPASLLDVPLYEAVRSALPPAAQDSESWRVDVVLDGFETPDSLRNLPLKALSGGWQRLALIARVWVNDPDMLMLDEPTNHLDLGKMSQLENWLNSLSPDVPVILASHDRDFLDATTNRTLFLRPGTSRYFALSYSPARQALEAEDAADEAKYERDLKEAQRLRRNAGELKNIGINSGSDLLQKKAKYLRQRAEGIEEALKPAHKDKTGDIRLSNSGTHARVLLALEDVAVTTPDDRLLFSVPKLHVFQGDRIVLLGANGAGKSQFVKLLHKALQTPDAVPAIRVSSSVVSAYVDQHMSQLPARGTPLEFISSRFDLGDQRSRALLAGAGFAVEKQDQPLAKLSYGQRARLGLLALRLIEPNFYLMDEPTNHVDIAGQEKLESEILAHGATCVLVSHDRRFVRNVGSRFLMIERRRLVEVDGPEAFFAAMAAEKS